MTAPMSRSRRAAFGATLTFTMAGPPLIVIALSALAPLVVADLDLTRAEFGSFATVAFAVAAVFSAAGGRLVDRVGGRPATMVVCGGACVALLLVAAAPTYGLVLAAVACPGSSWPSPIRRPTCSCPRTCPPDGGVPWSDSSRVVCS